MSTELKKQLVIRTGSVRRLGADHRSYLQEHESYKRALSGAIAAQPQDPHEVKKYRELIAECVATLHDITVRLEDASQSLSSFMTSNTELVGTPEWEKAQKTLNENRSHLTPASAPTESNEEKVDERSSSSTTAGAGSTLDGGDITAFSVAIYGGSQNKAGEAAYEDAVELGRVLASNKFHIVNGGYSGIMEAVSKGAASVPGATIEGIISPVAFPFQTAKGNQYLTHHTVTNDLPQRVITFLSRAQAFIVLPGSLGTLTEMCLTWDVSAVSTLRGNAPLTLLAYREPWQRVIDAARGIIPIGDHFMSMLKYVDSHDDIIAALNEAREKWNKNTESGSKPSTSTSSPPITTRI